jgi:hypothetical protein
MQLKVLKREDILTTHVPKKLASDLCKQNSHPRKSPISGSFHDSFAKYFRPDYPIAPGALLTAWIRNEPKENENL